MKKGLLLVLCIVAVAFLVGNSDYIFNFIDTLQTGAFIPLVVSIIVMVLRHVTQAQSYVAAFEAVDHHPTLRHEIILIFSLVFINTFCLFSGATGVAFIIDDAHRDGADMGKSTSGAILSQIGYFAAVFVISIIGFVTMLITGSINTVFLVGGLLLALVLLGLSSLFLVGHFKPGILYKLFGLLEKLINKALGVIHKSLKADWGKRTADSFVNNAATLAANPMGTFTTIAWASLSAILNMSCLIAIGYAFGFTELGPLIAAFALAAVSVIVSPTPQGVGVVEAAIIMILTASGCSVNTATAIALVYRGIMFWIPFCIGAFMLTQSGFFKSKKDASELQKAKDVAWISGVMVGIVGIVNIVLSVASSILQPYLLMIQFVDLSTLFPGWLAVVMGLVMLVIAFGLINRFRTVWAISLMLLMLFAAVDLFYAGTILPGLFMLGLSMWLFFNRDAFDQPLHLPRFKRAIQGDVDAPSVDALARSAEEKAAKQSVELEG